MGCVYLQMHPPIPVSCFPPSCHASSHAAFGVVGHDGGGGGFSRAAAAFPSTPMLVPLLVCRGYFPSYLIFTL